MGELSSNESRGPGVPVLMYHEISKIGERNKKERSTNPDYSLPVRRFLAQMNYLAKNRYQSLSLQELLGSRGRHNDRSVVITFDDGWLNNYTDAFPILKEHSLSATVFAVTGFIGRPGYMNWNELKEMDREGISIQSHTVSHRPLAELSDDELRFELEASKKEIEDRLGKVVDFVSLPHGMRRKNVLDAARKVGYKAVCTSEPGFSHRYGDPAVFKRINIADHYEIDVFRKIVERDEVFALSLMIAKTMKNLVKRVLGYNNYRRMYRLRYGIKD